MYPYPDTGIEDFWVRRRKKNARVMVLWYGIYFPYKSTIHNRNMSFKKTAGFALASTYKVLLFSRGVQLTTKIMYINTKW